MKMNQSFNERNIADDLDRILRASDPDIPDSLRPENMVSRIKHEYKPSVAHAFTAGSFRRWIPIAASCAACLILTALFFFHSFGIQTFQKSSSSSSANAENVKPNTNATKGTQEADHPASVTDPLTDRGTGAMDPESNNPQDTTHDDDVQNTNATDGTGKGTSVNASKSPTRKTNPANTTKGSAMPSVSSSPGANSSGSCGISDFSIDETAARKMIDAGALVIDLRTYAEYNAGHIAAAVNIPFDRLTVEISSAADVGKTVIVYHSTCEQSMDAAITLRNLKYDAYSLGAYNASWSGS